MTKSTRAFHVHSLIQGISQQAPQAVKQSSAKYQQNCVNDVLLGARARNGSTLKGYWPGNRVGAFHHRIKRSEDEDYLVLVTNGQLEVFNLADGTKCNVTGDISSYLTCSGSPDGLFSAATIEDTTIIANRQVIPAMATQRSPQRQNWAIAHFKSSNYLVTYKLSIKIVGGQTYEVSYETPDNSSAYNAAYLGTNILASLFMTALVNHGIPGFSFGRLGSTIVIYGPPGVDFSVATRDGLGGEQFIAFRERVKDISDLPFSMLAGYEVAVGASSKTRDYDYYLKYEGPEQNGKWVEHVAPDTEFSFNEATMPHLLVNTAKNAFEVRQGVWGKRISGDGINTSKNPEFVGRPIMDLNFVDSRLAIITEASYDFSRSKNAFSFFPDSAQTQLDTDPISATIANGKVTIVKGSVLVGRRLTLWANEIQTTVTSGDDILTETTIENLPTTSYEYDGRVSPKPFGQSSLIFGTSRGQWNDIREVLYRGENPAGDLHLNGHCQKLIRGKLRDIGIGESARIIHAITDEQTAKLYIYQWFNNGDERVQSAWNVFTWDTASRVIWTGTNGSKLHVLLDWDGTGHSLETIELEYEGDEENLVPLRVDHRVSENLVSSTGDGHVDVTLPYSVSPAKQKHFVAFQRLNDETTGEQRGVLLSTQWISPSVIRIFTDNPNVRFHVGAIVKAQRDLPRLFLEDRNGASILVETLKITDLFVRHTNSTHYHVEVERQGIEEPDIEKFTARRLGDPDIQNNRLAVEDAGYLKLRIQDDADRVDIRLVNDTIYPSSWESMKYHYIASSAAGG